MWTYSLAGALIFGLINDYRLVKNWPIDSLFISSSLLYNFYILETNNYDVENSIKFLLILIGLCFASFQRFFIGTLFHFNSNIEDWHEDFHDQLRRRRFTKQYLFNEHMSEVISYLLLFMLYLLMFMLTGTTIYSKYFFTGLLVEHYVGLKLRLRIQYNVFCDKHINKNPINSLDRFFSNAWAYYWMHLSLDRQSCLGFSSPYWDTLFNRNPFKSKWPYSSPLPFVDFLFVDYRDEIPEILSNLKNRQQIKSN